MSNPVTDRQLRRTVLMTVGIPGALFMPYFASQVHGGSVIGMLINAIAVLTFGTFLIWVCTHQHYFTGAQTIDGRLIHLLYAIRFFIRSACYLVIFTDMISRFLLPDTDQAVIAFFILLICGYGASHSLTGQTRIQELLFWWVMIPIVLVMILSVSGWQPELFSSQNYAALGESPSATLLSAYRTLMIFLPLESLLYLIPKCHKPSAGARAKQGLWIGIFLCLLVFLCAFLTIGEYALSVDYFGTAKMLRAITTPGSITNRIDMVAMPFLMIGLFIILNGNIANTVYAIHTSCRSFRYTPWILVSVLFILYLFLIPSHTVLAWYVRYACILDIPLAILLPLLCIAGDRIFYRSKKIMMGILILALICMTGCSRTDIEDQDYVLMLSVDPVDAKATAMPEYRYGAAMADMQGYRAETGEAVKMKTAFDTRENLTVFRDSYSRNHATRMNLGHINLILISEAMLKSPSMMTSLLDTWEQEDVLPPTVYVALTKESAASFITLDQESEIVLSAAIADMLRHDGNVAVTLQDLYLAYNENIPVTLPVLTSQNDAGYPQITSYQNTNAQSDRIIAPEQVNTTDK